MNIFFDVDQTILGMDNSLRPGVREAMAALTEMGHQVYVWSGMGIRRATVQRHGLENLVSGLYQKPLYDYLERLEELGVPIMPDFVTDDDPQVVSAFGGLWGSPLLRPRGRRRGNGARFDSGNGVCRNWPFLGRSFSGQGRLPAPHRVLRPFRKWLGVVLCVRM